MHGLGAVRNRFTSDSDRRHLTDGQWNDWDPQNPPLDYIELADKAQTVERPDQWIKPDKCV